MNKALLAKSTSQKPWKYRADSVSTTLGQQVSTLEQLEREQTHTHRQIILILQYTSEIDGEREVTEAIYDMSYKVFINLSVLLDELEAR